MKRIKVDSGAEGEESQNDNEDSQGESVMGDASRASAQVPNPATDEQLVEVEREMAADAGLIEKLRSECAEYQDKYLRAVADLENFKKRSTKERSDILKYAGESLARDLLDVVDSLQLAASQDVNASTEQMLKGIQLIMDQCLGVLERHGIKGETALGQPFDPNKHEALVSQPTAEFADGSVIQELKRTYFFKDKLLRPAQVVVAKAIEP